MAGSKRSASEEKKLEATVKKLRLRLDKAEARAERWKKEAVGQREAAAKSERQAKKLSKRLAKASGSAGPSEAVSLPDVDDESVALSPPDGCATEPSESAVTGPNESWTVVELRAEARSRGLTGMSGKSKAELLSALM